MKKGLSSFTQALLLLLPGSPEQISHGRSRFCTAQQRQAKPFLQCSQQRGVVVGHPADHAPRPRGRDHDGRNAPAAAQRAAAEQAILIGQLREALAAMDPATDRAVQGLILLGNVEEARGNNAAAAEAWRIALRTRFDATLAARAAEAAVRAEGGVSEASAALFRRALDVAPPDAPWRTAAEQRLTAPRIPGG